MADDIEVDAKLSFGDGRAFGGRPVSELPMTLNGRKIGVVKVRKVESGPEGYPPSFEGDLVLDDDHKDLRKLLEGPNLAMNVDGYSCFNISRDR